MTRLTTLLCLCAVTALATTARADDYKFYALKLPDPKPVNDFSLTNKGGEIFRLSSLRRKVVLLYFGFTHCPNTCPTTLANLAAATALLSKEDRSHVQVVFVSVDPERDTPELVKQYVTFFDDHFLGLTGSENEIAAAAKAYGVEYEPINRRAGDKNYLIDHTSATYILAPSGRWIGYYSDRQLTDSHKVADDLRHFVTLSPEHEQDWTTTESSRVVRTPRLSASELYVKNCASCHLANGEGIKGKYPPLAGSPWVTGSPRRLTALLMNGVTGPETVKGVTYSSVMPGWGEAIIPNDMAAIETYMRQAWGNSAPAVSPADTKALFYEFIRRKDFWTWPELEALPATSPDKLPPPAGSPPSGR